MDRHPRPTVCLGCRENSALRESIRTGYKEILSGDRLSPADEQTEIDDEISDQLKGDAGSRHDVAIMPQIPSGFGQNRGILFLAEDRAFGWMAHLATMDLAASSALTRHHKANNVSNGCVIRLVTRAIYGRPRLIKSERIV